MNHIYIDFFTLNQYNSIFSVNYMLDIVFSAKKYP